MQKKRYYIAYGSNLNIQQMQFRCPGAKIFGVGEIPDCRLLFKLCKTGSFLTVEPYPGASVPVAAWDITPENESALDGYESCPNYYYKKEMQLPIKETSAAEYQVRDVFAYIMREDRPVGVPSEKYMNTCRQGYADFGFPIEVLERAYLDSEREAGETEKE